jgi:hypothetical protein
MLIDWLRGEEWTHYNGDEDSTTEVEYYTVPKDKATHYRVWGTYMVVEIPKSTSLKYILLCWFNMSWSERKFRFQQWLRGIKK